VSPPPLEKASPSLLSRRTFLAKTTATVAASAGSILLNRSSVFAKPVPYDRTLRDRLWMWGHDAGSLKQGYGIGGPDDMTPGAALRYMGIPNVCMVRFTGTPLPPFDDYVKQFTDARRLTWSFVDGARNYTTGQKLQQALDLARKTSNLVGLDMDDFFIGDATPQTEGGEAAANLTLAQVEQVRKELTFDGRRLDLSLVVYSNQLQPAIGRHIDLVDLVYFWTWKARDLRNLEDNFAAYQRIAPGKRTLLGIYMWDFGEKKPIPLELMEHQCRLGLKWLNQGKIEGLIFHCTPLCGLHLEAVEWAKNWIARHGSAVIPGS
jgi:hypothetical protein